MAHIVQTWKEQQEQIKGKTQKTIIKQQQQQQQHTMTLEKKGRYKPKHKLEHESNLENPALKVVMDPFVNRLAHM